MKKLRKLWWNLFGWPDMPPRDFTVKIRVNQYTGKYYSSRADAMASMYLVGYNLQDIADHYGTTRERIRQCVWKVWRENQ